MPGLSVAGSHSKAPSLGYTKQWACFPPEEQLLLPGGNLPGLIRKGDEGSQKAFDGGIALNIASGWFSSMSLQITRIKPNPVGKDRTRYGQTPAAQLAAEWVDFKNTGAAAFDCGQLELWHRAYHHGKAPSWEKVMSFKGALQPGKIVRVHSGSGPDSVIRDEDRRGADFHLFTDKDYVWNNKEGDTPALFNPVTKITLDSASYDPNPPEGEELVRSGDKLVPARKAAYSS